MTTITTTATKKGLKNIAKRIEYQNLQADLRTLADHRTSIEVTLPAWLIPTAITKDGPDRKAFEKKLRETLRRHAWSNGYTIRMMDERMPEPAYDILKGSLRYIFHHSQRQHFRANEVVGKQPKSRTIVRLFFIYDSSKLYDIKKKT